MPLFQLGVPGVLSLYGILTLSNQIDLEAAISFGLGKNETSVCSDVHRAEDARFRYDYGANSMSLAWTAPTWMRR